MGSQPLIQEYMHLYGAKSFIIRTVTTQLGRSTNWESEMKRLLFVFQFYQPVIYRIDRYFIYSHDVIINQS